MASFCHLISVKIVSMWRPFRCEFRRTSDGNIFGTLCMLILQLLIRLQQNAFVGFALPVQEPRYICAGVCVCALVIVRLFVVTRVDVGSEDCGRRTKNGKGRREVEKEDTTFIYTFSVCDVLLLYFVTRW